MDKLKDHAFYALVAAEGKENVCSSPRQREGLCISPRSGDEKVARRDTSGTRAINDLCALEARTEKPTICARLQRADQRSLLIQTFHVWLPSLRRCRGETNFQLPSLRRCRGETNF